MDNKNEILGVLIANIVNEKRTEEIDMILCLSMEGKMS